MVEKLTEKFGKKNINLIKQSLDENLADKSYINANLL
jgi:hypothetical protein